ncbi:thermonuclease family protein [Desulfovibrio sp. ZJ200]|uniref:thermonuclease family protein n=1 Tax=Desulfovibrio sp. ZJ200 TaxID=2709792 RepID=UPI0013E9D27F|nr:thermonuclease family protein [Desulfovibrio sp. ZJ200]
MSISRNNLPRLQAALFLVLCCLLLPLTALGQEIPLPQPAGVVARCFDGDTLMLADRRIVRLAGIDAPELAHDGEKAQYYARQSREELTRLAKGRKVRLFAAGINSRDRHGRIVADVRLEDGQSLSDLMLSRGAAFYYPHQDQSPQFQERLRGLQEQAVSGRRGLWARLLSLPLARENYTGNRTSLRFFPAACPEAEHIKPRNRIYFGTLMDAFLAGYAPARVCPFWPAQP